MKKAIHISQLSIKLRNHLHAPSHTFTHLTLRSGAASFCFGEDDPASFVCSAGWAGTCAVRSLSSADVNLDQRYVAPPTNGSAAADYFLVTAELEVPIATVDSRWQRTHGLRADGD